MTPELKGETRTCGSLPHEPVITMTKILSIEERVDSVIALDGRRAIVKAVLREDRTALLTELMDSGLLEEKEEHLDWCKLTGELEYSSCGCWKDHNTLARAMKAHLDELIKANK